MAAGRIRDSEASQEKILDAAEQLFIEQGYTATSLRQVAAQAKVAKSLIFHHFQTKAELWDQVKARRMGAFARRQHEVFDQGAVSLDHLVGAIREYFYLLRQDPQLVRLLMQTKLEGADPNDDRQHDHFDMQLVREFIERLERARQAGLLRADLQPCYILALIMAAVNNWFEARNKYTQWPHIAGNKQCDEEFLQAFIDILLNGVLPREE